MSDEARKRLQAIFNASELGAGFQIALSDLEIRGAGNILGGEQSGHMAAVGFDLYSRMLAEAVEEGKAAREGRRAAASRRHPGGRGPAASKPICPTTTFPTRPRSWSCTGGWRGPAPPATSRRSVRRSRTGSVRCHRRRSGSSRSRSCVSPAEGAGVSSISREEGWLVVRFGAGLSRATAMSLLGPGALPGIRPSEVTFASNQVRIRLPKDPKKAWGLTQAIVARLSTQDQQGVGQPAPDREVIE